MTESLSDDGKPRFNVRWAALGVALSLLMILGGEALVWQLLGEESVQFLRQAMATVNSPGVTVAQREALAPEVFSRLALPSIIAVSAVVLFAPALIGGAVTFGSRHLWSGPIACTAGGLLALIASNALMAGPNPIANLILVFVYGVGAIPGSLIASWLLRRRETRGEG